MKKLLLFILMALLPILSFADKAEINGLWYNLVPKANQAEVIKYGDTSYSGDIEIPATIEYGGTTYSVTSIGNGAFYNCYYMTSIAIPGSVTSIDNYAFEGCSGLTSVHISDLESWCKIAFKGSFSNPFTFAHHLFLNGVKIKDLVIPNSVTSIGNYAFYSCSGLTSITISNSVKGIGDYAFSGCSGLTSITIPSSVWRIGDYTFSGCTGLTSVIIPGSVTSIGNGVFSRCSSLTSITIPNSVTSISNFAFWGCSGLTSVTIPNSVTSIGNYAFSSCSGLTSITIPNSVKGIGDYAFYDCSGLTSVTIGSGVMSIGRSAFANCQELTDVYCYTENFPLNIYGDAFEGSYIEYATLHIPTSSVEAYRGHSPWSSFGSIVSLEEESEDDTYINGIYYDFSDSEAKVIKGKNAYSGDVVIPASVIYKGKTYNVSSIGDLAFFQCSGLTSISIPNSVQTIGELAFATCSGLTSIYIPESVTTIGVGAFAECTGLTSISIPESMTGISESLFFGCSNLTSVIIPKGVTSIGEEAFAYCSKLKNVYCFAEQVPNTADNAFENTPIQSAVLQVPAISVEAYRVTEPWSYFGSIVPLEGESEDGTYIDGIYYSFSEDFAEVISGEKSYFGNVLIPASVSYKGKNYNVASIDEYAFFQCSGLTSITIPKSVTYIGKNAFEGCKLHNVFVKSVIPPSIEMSSFSPNIYNHTILYIPNGSWGEYVFNSNWYQFINIRETTTEEEQLSMLQTYTLMDANTFAYSVYDPVNDCIGAVGVVNEDNPNHCWQVIEADGNHYLYNLGAKKFVTSYGNSLNLAKNPNTIEIENGKDGIVLGKQEGNQWAFVSNESMNVEQSITDAIIAMQGTSHPQQADTDIYDLNGRRLSAPQKGINILRMSDGTMKKVMIK